MPCRVLHKETLILGRTSLLVVEAPHIANKALPGNFVVVRTHERGERIPLTIADVDKKAGTFTLVFLVMGKTTSYLDGLAEGDEILDVCGPLGKPTHITKGGAVICVGGGTGIAAMHHIAKGHSEAGNRVIAIIGARTKELLLFEKELRNVADEMLICTNDGSYGSQGMVTDLLRKRLEEGPDVSEVIAVGPVPMMEAVAELTRPLGVKTTVSLNPIMVDGMGMCGACRVSVNNETRFACVEGPEFDGHQVNFAELQQRLATFREQEGVAMEQHRCKCHEKH